MPPRRVHAFWHPGGVGAAAARLLAETDLVRVSDADPGIRRHRTGKGFVYVDRHGRRLTDPRTLARIRALAIPPAWTDVWICCRADGHLQAAGRDARGRKQYRYHPWFRQARDSAKYERLLRLVTKLPRIRHAVQRALGMHGLGHDKVVATVVRILDGTGMRVGNPEYARANGAYGLTTLRDGHVRLLRGALRFRYRGKSGRERDVRFDDPHVAGIVRRCRDLPGDELFQWVDGRGARHRIGSADVNAWLRGVSGADVTAKDFRTWTATVTCFRALRALAPPPSVRDAKRRAKAAVQWTAERLGNTPAVCRRSYIHPVVLAAYERREALPADRRPAPRAALLRAEEATMAAWLRSRCRAPRSRRLAR